MSKKRYGCAAMTASSEENHCTHYVVIDSKVEQQTFDEMFVTQEIIQEALNIYDKTGKTPTELLHTNKTMANTIRNLKKRLDALAEYLK